MLSLSSFAFKSNLRHYIELCEDAVDVSKMQRAYELVKIADLPRKIGARGVVDICGVVTSVGELGAVRRKSDNSEVQRRDVTIVDDSMRSVVLTLWNTLATEQGALLAQEAANSPVIAVRGVKVRHGCKLDPNLKAPGFKGSTY